MFMKYWGKLGIVSMFAGLLFGAVNVQPAAAKSKQKTPTNPISKAFTDMTSTNIIKAQKLGKNDDVTFDIVLKPRNEQAMYQQALAVNTPGNADFKDYLTPAGIREKFGQSTTITNDWKSYLKQHHLQADAMDNGLLIVVDGKVKNINKTFRMDLNKATYHANPLQFGKAKPKIPGRLSKTVYTVVGMADHNSSRYFFPNTKVQLAMNGAQADTTTNFAKKGGYTSRFTDRYNVDSLYGQGATGKGQSIGLIGLGGVQRSNVLHFWNHEGASTNPSRLSVKQVPSDMVVYAKQLIQSNSMETTMDAEYAGSVAPQANVRIYWSESAFPTLVNAINSYSTAFNENRVSALSSSWALGPNSYMQLLKQRRVLTPKYADLYNLVYAQGALQGISLFTASGDTGAAKYAFKSVHGNQVLVDRTINESDPGDTSPWLTSVGGTTLPFKQTNYGVTVNVEKERAWGYDYFWPIFESHPSLVQKTPSMLSQTGGSTGGFSGVYPTPDYQKTVPGVNTFAARQYLSNLNQPAFNPALLTGTATGRNYPDVSADADPSTGYMIYQKGLSKSGWKLSGGTSIVAPQFAGVTALINSEPGRTRMGFWNPQLYRLATQSDTPFHPMNDTENNSNLYFTGQPNTDYNQATGLGTVDFGKLAQVYK